MNLSFVSGNPGSTGRLKTLAQMEYDRDSRYPRTLNNYHRRINALREYAKIGAEQKRRANRLIFGLENSIKAVSGYLEGLKDPKKMKIKKEREQAFRSKVDSDEAWQTIATTRAELKKHVKKLNASQFHGRILGMAGTIVQLAEELEKPNEERLPRFRDSSLDSLKFQLFSPAPLFQDLETVNLQSALEDALEKVGKEDAYIQAALQGKTPRPSGQRNNGENPAV